MLSRRFLLRAAPVLIAAPAIVRVANLMPVSVIDAPLSAAEVATLHERWLLAVTNVLEKFINPPEVVLSDLAVYGRATAFRSTPLRPPAQKWFTLTIDRANKVAAFGPA